LKGMFVKIFLRKKLCVRFHIKGHSYSLKSRFCVYFRLVISKKEEYAPNIHKMSIETSSII